MMVIAVLIAMGAGAAAFDATDQLERTYDFYGAAIALAVFAIAAIIDRARKGSSNVVRFLKGPGKVILIYAVAIPAATYWLIGNVFSLSADGNVILAGIVGMGGFGLAVWRWNKGS